MNYFDSDRNDEDIICIYSHNFQKLNINSE